MNPSVRRHPTLILVLTAVLAWPWSAALAVSSCPARSGDGPSAAASTASGHAGKSGRHDRSQGGAISPALDDSDDGDGVDCEAMLHLIAADSACFAAPEPALHPSSQATPALPPSPRSGAAPFRLIC